MNEGSWREIVHTGATEKHSLGKEVPGLRLPFLFFFSFFPLAELEQHRKLEGVVMLRKQLHQHRYDFCNNIPWVVVAGLLFWGVMMSKRLGLGWFGFCLIPVGSAST